jgi:hypothetical protein
MILPISCPISVFFRISATISGQYRDIPVPCQTRYRVFHRYRARYGPNIAKISEYTDIGTQKPQCRSRCVYNIAIYLYRVLPISGVFPDIWDDVSPAAPPPPAGACHTGPEATVQALQPVQPLGPSPQLCRPKGQCHWYCLYPCAQRATAEKGPGLGWCQHTQNLKLETGIIEFQSASLVTVAADI